jgi:hypothetical protein
MPVELPGHLQQPKSYPYRTDLYISLFPVLHNAAENGNALNRFINAIKTCDSDQRVSRIKPVKEVKYFR